ncbi:MAG: hypothetical protein QOG94_2692 [Solirubrobacteraceae bacterium]|nr:hypothetical protein [Solirubrobacteraceae bacterium]
MPLRLSLRTGATALIAIAALAASTAVADAGVLVASAPSCDGQALAKPFTPWLDVADYTALGGGNFEGDGAGWSTTGAAGIADGNESFHVGGAADDQSLALGAGSSATSPSICVGLEHPTIRFFAKRRSANVLSTLRVDALVELSGGAVLTVPIGVVANPGMWQPTLPIAVVANLLPLLPGDHTAVAFRFTPQGGDWSIDDVWVDPYGRKP